MRLTWTSSGERKMPTRDAMPPRNFGSSTSPTSFTTPSAGAITRNWPRVPDVKSDPPRRRLGRRREERLDLPPDVAERAVVGEERGVDLREPLEDFDVRREALPHPDEGAHDVDAHPDRAAAAEDIGH